MSLLNNSNAISASGAEYTMTDSIRWRGANSAHLRRTYSTTPTDAKKLTLSLWMKRGARLNYDQIFLSGYNGSSADRSTLWLTSANQMRFNFGGGSSTAAFITNQVFRDTSAWFHIVIAIDTTQGTSSNRVKLYINGEQVTSFSSTSYPAQNATHQFLYQNSLNWIGTLTGANYQFDGYITEFHAVDGQALSPTSFGDYNSDTGVWQAKSYSGTHGNNGFYLDMSTSGSTVLDQSSNSNDWTANNMDFTNTTSYAYDKMTDVPTLTDEDTCNYPTLNSATATSLGNVTNGGQTFTWNTTSENGCHASMMIPKSGKWYWEVYINNQQDGYVGISQPLSTSDIRIGNKGWYLRRNGWFVKDGAQPSGSGTGWGAGSTVRLLIDSDNNQIQTYVNNTANSVVNYDFTTNDYFAQLWMYNATMSINFGQRPFKYSIPSGYKKLNSFNLDDSAVPDGSKHFTPVIWNGNGSTQTISGLEFSPDWIWITGRNFSDYRQAFNTSSGVNKNLSLNQIVAEQSGTSVTAFNSDGWTMGSWNNINGSGRTYSGEVWRASDSSPVSNTAGTITSSVSANTTAGFSMVTWTGNGAAGATIGHGLGTAPSVVITKGRSYSQNWAVYHSALGPTKWLQLNSTVAQLTETAIWNNTAPTSSVFTHGNSAAVNPNGGTNISFCFAEVEGFSKFGSYLGNGSANGAFVYTGFRPAVVITKSATESRHWTFVDTTRSPYNQTNETLEISSSNGENPYDDLDILSNGFKARTTDPGANGNGQTILYMAFAENPFKNALAR